MLCCRSIYAKEIISVGYADFKLGMSNTEVIQIIKENYSSKGWVISHLERNHQDDVWIKIGYMLTNSVLDQEIDIEFTEGQNGVISQVRFKEGFSSETDLENKTSEIKSILLAKYGNPGKTDTINFLWYPNKKIIIQLTHMADWSPCTLFLTYWDKDLTKLSDNYRDSEVAKKKALKYDKEKDKY